MKHVGVLALALGLMGACRPGGDESWLDGGTEDGEEGGNAEIGCESLELGAPVLRRLTRVELRDSLVAVFPELSVDWEGSALGPDPVSERGFSNDAALLTVGDQTAAEILATAENAAADLTTAQGIETMLPCSQDAADTACAETLIAGRGRLLFHRALTEAELAEYRALFEDIAGASDFATGVHWTLVAMISSPNFLYRFELGPEGSSGARDLLDWEVATALAYTYSGVGPTASVLDRAEAGEFSDAAGRVALAEELLSESRAEAILGRFFAEWIRYGRAASKIKSQVDDYEDVRGDMVEETRRFIDRVVRVDGGSMRELLVAADSEVNGALASYYGWGDPAAADFETQTRPENYAVGLLAQGSVLAGHAHTDSSSPTQRGLLLHEKLLCNPSLSPPPDVPSIDPPEPGNTTTRERYEIAHAGEDACAACHRFFDPLGFAFEHFDEAGRYRADESGLTIDASGSITLASGSQLTFNGLTELAEGLSREVQVHACAGDNIERFAFGGEVDGCRDLDLREALVAGELGLADYFVQLAGSASFARRE